MNATATIDNNIITVSRVIQYDVHEGITSDILINAIRGIEDLNARANKILAKSLGVKRGDLGPQKIVFTEIKENCIKLRYLVNIALNKGCLKYLDKVVKSGIKGINKMEPDARNTLLKEGRMTVVRTTGIIAAAVVACVYLGSNVLSKDSIKADKGSIVIQGDSNNVNSGITKEEKLLLKSINTNLEKLPTDLAKTMAPVLKEVAKENAEDLKAEAVLLYRPGKIMPNQVRFIEEDGGTSEEAWKIDAPILTAIPEKYEREETDVKEIEMKDVDLLISKADDRSDSKNAWGSHADSTNPLEQAILSSGRVETILPEGLRTKMTFAKTQKADIKVFYKKEKNKTKVLHYEVLDLK